jgi:hypothetical protein
LLTEELYVGCEAQFHRTEYRMGFYNPCSCFDDASGFLLKYIGRVRGIQIENV